MSFQPPLLLYTHLLGDQSYYSFLIGITSYQLTYHHSKVLNSWVPGDYMMLRMRELHGHSNVLNSCVPGDNMMLRMRELQARQYQKHKTAMVVLRV